MDRATLGPAQVEIEHTGPGPIIHIFPEAGDPYYLVRDLLAGLYLLHASKENVNTIAEILNPELGDKSKKLLNEKLITQQRLLLEADAYSLKFLDKMKHK